MTRGRVRQVWRITIKNHRATNSLLILLLGIVAGALCQCAPTGLFETKPQLGDTSQRQTDGAAMVFVPSGEFLMGIDYLGMRYAIQLCRQLKGSVENGVCQRAPFANEMLAHPVVLDAFWIDRTEVTNGQYQR